MKELSLHAETIDGYYVDENIKKLWSVQLNIYKEFKRICDENNLKYCAYAGTLLGIVRHNGAYIPWDDDLDVCMPYMDYCKFKIIVENELNDKYLFQSFETEHGFTPFFSRIRNKKTIFITENDSHYPKWNKGIFIDIFPMSNVSDNKLLESIHICLICVSYTLFLGKDYFIRKNDKSSNIKKIVKALSIIPYGLVRAFLSSNKTIELIEQIANIYKNKNTKYVSNYSGLFNGQEYKKYIFPREMISEMVEHDFYDTKIYIPKNYDSVLKIHYGNWKKIIRDKSLHQTIKIDVNENNYTN